MTRPLNIAHRGARSLAPENTLAAARAALAVGADMWELDVSLTADGELVVLHDDTLVRTTNVEQLFPERSPWFISDFTLAEIKQLDTGGPFVAKDPFEQIGAGHLSRADVESLDGEPIPTLREALLFTRNHNWRVNVEIKPLLPPRHTFPLAERVAALISELEMDEQVLVSSFVPLYLKQIKERSPAIETAVLTEGPMPLGEQQKYEQLGIELSPLLYFDGTDPVSFLAALGSQIYHPYYAMLTDIGIKELRQAGLEVNLWTVNDRTHMARLVKAGVTGIITDFPQALSQVLGV
jgi:glycerophosphoryl diester phosphodiesterase